jgi:hypothetical protein
MPRVLGWRCARHLEDKADGEHEVAREATKMRVVFFCLAVGLKHCEAVIRYFDEDDNQLINSMWQSHGEEGSQIFNGNHNAEHLL